MPQKTSGYGICALVSGYGAIATLACAQVTLPPSSSAPAATAMLVETSLPAISASELALGGIFPGDDEATVIGKLGQPNHVVEDFGDRTFEYTDFAVFFYEGRVIEVTSTHSAYCTPSGICPNMAFARARAQYGTPTVTNREDGKYMEYYPSEPVGCWLKISVDGDDDIDAITVECQL